MKAELAFDVLSLAEPEGARKFGEVIDDPFRYMDVFWLICREEAAKNNVDQESFFAGFGGDSIELARDALVREIIDFFPNPRTRGMLTRIVTIARKAQEKVMDQAEESLKKLSADEIIRRLKTSSGSSPESAGSILIDLPSGN